MRKTVRKSGSVLLAFLLLFSTLSFTLDMHFCGKSLVDFSLYHEAEGCGMAMDDSLTTEMGCCNDLEIVVQGQDNLDQLAPSPLIPVAVFVSYLSHTFQWDDPQNLDEAYVPHGQYVPPLLIRNISLRDQVFLI